MHVNRWHFETRKIDFHLQEVDGCLVKTGFHFMNRFELKRIQLSSDARLHPLKKPTKSTVASVVCITLSHGDSD